MCIASLVSPSTHPVSLQGGLTSCQTAESLFLEYFPFWQYQASDFPFQNEIPGKISISHDVLFHSLTAKGRESFWNVFIQPGLLHFSTPSWLGSGVCQADG